MLFQIITALLLQRNLPITEIQRILEVHCKGLRGTLQIIFVAGFTVYTHSYLFNPDIHLHIHSDECTVKLLNQAGRNNYPYNP